MNTGELIRKYRLEGGMTQCQLAEKVGILESSIRLYELGMRNATIQRLKEIADALGVLFSCLLEFDTKNYKEKTLADFTTVEILTEIKRRIESNYEKSSTKRECKRQEKTL